jgi:crotonobetainyl-CoA:carnitine CoA-transferase CaiB-like acyl-CoA transferase
VTTPFAPLTGADPGHPQRVEVPIGDLTAGIYGAYGVLAALRERDRTGRGQVVRTSLLAALVGVHAFQGTAAAHARRRAVIIDAPGAEPAGPGHRLRDVPLGPP